MIAYISGPHFVRVGVPMPGVDGNLVEWSAQVVRGPNLMGRSVEAHTAGRADDMLKAFAGLDGVSERLSQYEARLVVWCAHIAATGSSTSSDGIALAPDGGPWRSFYTNAVSGRKPFFLFCFSQPLFLFLIFFFFQLRRHALDATLEAVRSATPTREREGDSMSQM